MSLKDFFAGKKIIIIAIIVMALGGGGFFAWKMLGQDQNPQSYVQTLNKAMLEGDLTTLVKIVDFRSLTEDMARQILADPQIPSIIKLENKSLSALSQNIEQVFIKSMQERTAAPKPSQNTDPFAPLAPVPEDFAKQITGKFTLHGSSQNSAIATVNFNHPRLEKDFPMHFLLEQAPNWKMTKLVNMPDLLQEYIKEEKNLLGARQKHHKMLRDKDKKRIEQQFKLDECKAFVHKPSGQKTPLLTVRIKGYNNGPFTIRNMTFDTRVVIHNKGGELIYNHDINTASQLRVGITLEDSYTIDLEEGDKETEFLTKATKVTCDAVVQYMTLDDGKVLYIDDDDKTLKHPGSSRKITNDAQKK